MAVQKQDDQHEHTFSSYVRIRDVVLKTYLGRWTIGRSDERASGISVLPARDDDETITKEISSFIPFPRDTVIHVWTHFLRYHSPVRQPLLHILRYAQSWDNVLVIVFRNIFSIKKKSKTKENKKYWCEKFMEYW